MFEFIHYLKYIYFYLFNYKKNIITCGFSSEYLSVRPDTGVLCIFVSKI